MKKIALFVCLALLTMGVLSACNGSITQTTTTAEETYETEVIKGKTGEVTTEAESIQKTGGWTINEALTCQLSNDDREVFDKALEGLTGVGYEPINCLGSQVVSGTNLAYLSKGTTVTAEPETGLYIVMVYNDLNNNSSVLNIADFNLDDYTTGKHDTPPETGLSGGWTVNSEIKGTIEDKDAKEAFEKASAGLTGVSYEPVALLGTQVVAGTNYAFLCKATTVTADPQVNLVVAVVYSPVDGSDPSFTSFDYINLADFNK